MTFASASEHQFEAIVKEGLIKPQELWYIQAETLSWYYGWKPDEIRKMAIIDKLAYMAIIRGSDKREPKQLRKVR